MTCPNLVCESVSGLLDGDKSTYPTLMFWQVIFQRFTSLLEHSESRGLAIKIQTPLVQYFTLHCQLQLTNCPSTLTTLLHNSSLLVARGVIVDNTMAHTDHTDHTITEKMLGETRLINKAASGVSFFLGYS